MVIDTTQPWGIALDYAGRATVTENGHTIDIRIYDTTVGSPLEPDPASGAYPTVYVTAQFSESGPSGSVLRGFGRVVLTPSGSGPVSPDQTAVQSAVAAALSDFGNRAVAYATLCAAWATGV